MGINYHGVIRIVAAAAALASSGADLGPAHADETVNTDRQNNGAAVSNVLSEGTAEGYDEAENFDPVKIRAQKIAVRSKPGSGNSTEFHLYSEMEITPVERVRIKNTNWVRFEIGIQSFWLNEDENAKAKEQKEKPEGYKIVIKKDTRTLTLLHGDGHRWEEKEAAMIGLAGYGEKGHRKKIEGDGGTPEGKYYVSLRNPASMFGENSRGGPLGSLYISYPNAHDAMLAWQEGRADLETYRRVTYAVERKQTPPLDTGMGNYIMIHGGGASDWTGGCIALDNEVMERLYRLAREGTPVEIEP